MSHGQWTVSSELEAVFIQTECSARPHWELGREHTKSLTHHITQEKHPFK